MSKIKQGLLVGTVLSTLVLTSVHAAPLEGVLVIAQAPQADQQTEKEKKSPQRPNQQPPGQEQRRERQVQPPPPQGQQQPQERQLQPPAQQRQVQPPPSPPGQEQRRERQVQPPPPQGQQQPQERQVQPPPSQQREMQPPPQGAQPLPVPQQQQGQRGGEAPRCNRRVRLHRSSRYSPRWHRPRFNCRLRRPDLRRHRSNGPSCHRRLRIMRGILMMSAEPV